MNPFESLDAQSLESRLAQVSSDEVTTQPNPLDADTYSLRDMLLDDIGTDIDLQWIMDEAILYSIGITP